MKNENNDIDILKTLNQVAEQNLIDIEEVREIFKESIFKIFHKELDPDAELEITFDDNKVRLINRTKQVVDGETEYRTIEVPLSVAREVNPNIEEGDVFAEEVDLKSKYFTNVNQQFTQRLRESKKEAVYAKHKSLKGEMIDVTVTSSTKGAVLLELDDGTVAFMPQKLRNLKIPLSIGERTKVFVEDVLSESRDSQIVVSNGSPTIVKRLIENEVPEVMQGLVEIVKISRAAGSRTKIAVRTTNPNIDPVGAIIGSRGSRINAIVEKLDNEKIDIIPWSENIDVFVANALSPSKVVSIQNKKDANGEDDPLHKIAITPNRHQTLAIGKQGSNARLAVDLTGVGIDIISMADAEEKGIPIIWNGNVDMEDLDDIERGIRQTHRPRQTGSMNGQNTAQILTDMESEISTFQEEMSIDDIQEDVEDSQTNTDEFNFSDDDLEQMQADFGFDEESSDTNFDEYDLLEDEEENLE